MKSYLAKKRTVSVVSRKIDGDRDCHAKENDKYCMFLSSVEFKTQGGGWGRG